MNKTKEANEVLFTSFASVVLFIDSPLGLMGACKNCLCVFLSEAPNNGEFIAFLMIFK